MAARELTAQYQSRCTKCGGLMKPGTSIMYEKGVGSWHKTCPAKAAAAPVASAKGDVTAAPFVIHERWEGCNAALQQSRLAAVIGESRRYVLRPATRRVRGQAGRARYVSGSCEVCGAAPFARCSPPAGTNTREEAYYIAGQPTPTEGWPRGPVCITAATPDRDEPVSDEDQRRNLPTLRDGAEGAIESGVYMVVSVGRWRYQNATDNEDMGDMSGVNWSGALFLRRAITEEEQKDAEERLKTAMPEILRALAGFFDRAARRQAEAAMAAAAERSGYARVAIDFCDALALTPEDVAERKATRQELWHGVDRDYSYVCTWTWRGREIFESHDYIYDFDQPTVYVGPAELVERAAVAQAMVGFGWAIQSIERRWAREAQAAGAGKAA